MTAILFPRKNNIPIPQEIESIVIVGSIFTQTFIDNSL